jgi:hypothetical protein
MRGWVGDKPTGLGVFVVQSWWSLVAQKSFYFEFEIKI